MIADERVAKSRMTYVSGIAEAVSEAMREDSSVFLAGEDVGTAGSVFGIFRGLLAEFGADRVVDTPISEQALVGLGIGAAANGLRPVIDIMFMDFIGECMDEIVNQLAKMRYMLGGNVKLPVTITTMSGAGASAAAQHSQSLEAWLAHVPGLKVVMPATPRDAKALTRAAIADDNPVIMVYNKLSLGLTEDVDAEFEVLPIGKARIAREGADFTVVAVGRMVHEAVEAANVLAAEGCEIEVVDLRSVQPLDIDLVLASVKKTHRVVVVHEAVRFCGIGAEVAAQVAEAAFDFLDAPVGRVGAPFAPVPFSPPLEEAYVPGAPSIAHAVRQTLAERG